MRKVLATLLALSLVVSMFTGVFAPMPATRAASVVNLGTAGDFVILAKTAITTTGATSIKGDIGISPAAASSIAGFGLVMDSTNTFSTSSLVDGKLYASSYAPPTPTKMSTAISDMEAAYTAPPDSQPTLPSWAAELSPCRLWFPVSTSGPRR